MAANAPPKPSPKITRESWADWLPDVEPTLTIEDVVDSVRSTGVDGTEDLTIEKVRYWQRAGLLPAPIRRKPGEETSRARALYPPQAFNAVLLICTMQHNGTRLRDMHELLGRMFSIERVQLHLRDAVKNAAQQQQQRTGSPIHKVEVILTDARNRKFPYTFNLVNDEDEESPEDNV